MIRKQKCNECCRYMLNYPNSPDISRGCLHAEEKCWSNWPDPSSRVMCSYAFVSVFICPWTSSCHGDIGLARTFLIINTIEYETLRPSIFIITDLYTSGVTKYSLVKYAVNYEMHNNRPPRT